MKPGITISCVGHAGVLLWGLIAFAAKPMSAPPAEALPVDFISAKQFSELTAGVKNAKKLETAKPLADKVDVPKPIKQLAPKVADKPEIVTNTAPPKPPPMPEPKPPEKTEKKKEPEPKLDQIAQELKKEQAEKPKPEEKPAPKKPAPKKPVRQTPKFDPKQVAALLDKREPRRQIATAETLNGSPSLGTSTGHAAHLSQSEIDALRAKLISLWNPPQAISTEPDKYIVTIRIRLGRNHKLAGPPTVLTSGAGTLFEATRDSAVRAVFQAQPYDMLSQATYDQWKEMDINFNPREVFGG
jgi:colicin import membrane protein